ncbi:MAG TPA: Eco57I restriction-modification methylase domain-containing protein, partial [Candidatus Hydrogenedentes bacterium]|nr:Eco57I restriction-modification methylase domain-containing protein [Candidatus Hydrogenedentota bacterium]
VGQVLTEQNLWKEIDTLLQNVSAVDPACGSGAFLIGMLQVLDELLQRSGYAVGRAETPYERKQQIIGRSLYGVDVMPWAVDVAELRLWLQLVVETELSVPERKMKPLLPNLNFKIRQGDSLIQMVGNIDFSYMRSFSSLSASLKGRLRELKGDKLRFFNNQFQNKQQTRNSIDKKERDIFDDILAERQHDITNKLKDLRTAIKPIAMLDGSRECPLSPKDAKEVELEIASLETEKKQLSEAIHSLRKTKKTPFVWDIAFVEIFEDSKKGFDIVVGNPPYVRQELIADPLLSQAKQTTAENKKYKEKLIRSVYALWPSFFGVNPEKPDRKLDQKNDLYCYFFFHGLARLNTKGSFIFITSNSWLDVGYGKDLQEFLLTQSHVKMIIDNKSKRSFKSADVNTVIALLGAPEKQKRSPRDKTARFLMFKEPFDAVDLLESFKAAEKAKERTTLDQCRIFPIDQQTLWEQGSDALSADAPSGGKDKKTLTTLLHSAKYIGNKWGGKYLRAPDIYWTLLEKGKGKLFSLGSVAEVRRGITSGANNFFYLSQETADKWGIEKEFLKPIILSPRECPGTLVTKDTLNFQAFFCNKDETSLKGSNALRYIAWGESQGFHERPSCKTRTLWYSLPDRKWARILWPMIHNDRLGVYWNKSRIAVDHNLFEIMSANDYVVWGSLAWTGQVIFRELHGRANLGQGALKTEGTDIKTLYAIDSKDKGLTEVFRHVLSDLSDLNIDAVETEVKKSERIKLDNILSDYLKLSRGERDAVYEAAIELIDLRLQKASSLNA